MANPSFQVDDELLDQLDEIIWQKMKDGELPRNTSRSDILRDLVEEYVEGNGSISNSPTMQPAD